MTEKRAMSPRKAVLQHLESLQSAGVLQLAPARPLSPTAPSVHQPDRQPVRQPSPTQASPDMPKTNDPPISSAATLDILQAEVADCSLCEELASTRTQTVFGVGDPKARLCFLGEAPGAKEDELGEPFVGRAGKLLDKILEACHLQRDEIYILNVLKCRPPGNRNPSPEESQNCRRFLNRQLELIQPEFICCLGAVAAQNLLESTSTIGQLRGSVHQYRGIPVVCTYHPAYLLRNPSAKRHTWDDMKLLMCEMGTPVD